MRYLYTEGWGGLTVRPRVAFPAAPQVEMHAYSKWWKAAVLCVAPLFHHDHSPHLMARVLPPRRYNTASVNLLADGWAQRGESWRKLDMYTKVKKKKFKFLK